MNSISLLAIGLFKLSIIVVVFAFWGIDPYHINCQIYVCRDFLCVWHHLIILIFAESIIYSSSFIPDIGNQCLSSFFFFFSVVRGWSWYRSFHTVSSSFHWFSLLFFCYNYIGFCPLLFPFFYLLWDYFALIFLLSWGVV